MGVSGKHRRAGARYVNGSVRTAGWALPENVRCPNGHRFRDTAIQFGNGALRCTTCDRLLWALFNPHNDLVFLAEIDMADVRAMKAHASLLETLRYLGQPIYPVRR